MSDYNYQGCMLVGKAVEAGAKDIAEAIDGARNALAVIAATLAAIAMENGVSTEDINALVSTLEETRGSK